MLRPSPYKSRDKWLWMPDCVCVCARLLFLSAFCSLSAHMFAIVSWTSNGCCLITCKFRPYAAIINISYEMPGQNTVCIAFMILGCDAPSSEFPIKLLVPPPLLNGELWLEWRKVFRWHPLHFALCFIDKWLLFIFQNDNAPNQSEKCGSVTLASEYDCLNGRQRMPKLTNFMNYVSTKTHFSYYVDRITCIWYEQRPESAVSMLNTLAASHSLYLHFCLSFGPIHLRPGMCHPSLFTFRIHRTYRATQWLAHTIGRSGWGYDLCLFRV